MFNPERGTSPLRIGLALVAALLLFGVGGGESRAGTNQENEQEAKMACERAWVENPASDSCQNAQVSAQTSSPDDAVCTVSAMCNTTSAGDTQSLTTITVDPDSVSGLNNCAGTLTNGDC